MELGLKIFRMNRLGIPKNRIAERLCLPQQTLSNHLPKMPSLAFPVNSDLSRGFTVSQVAEKHGWTEPMVWSLALEGKDDLQQFEELDWYLMVWDFWEWSRYDKRFGDEWPERISGQMIAHILYFFSQQNDLVFDPMGGGGVTADVCLAFNRRCWTVDMVDRPSTRPEIEPCYWDIKGDFKNNLQTAGFFNAKQKPDIIILDPPSFENKVGDCVDKGISTLPREEYLDFLERFFTFMKEHSKKTTRLACIARDWRNFENTPAAEETGEGSILIDDYLRILNKAGWQHTHIIQAPLSPDRFSAEDIARMQKKKILGVTNRYVIVLRQ